MASLQERNGSYRVLFCYHGKLHSFTIGQVEKDEAEYKARQVDYLLMRLKQRLMRLVQEWAGHMNEATSKRYRHLYPSTQQEAINRVFG
jgi:ribosomal protein S4E